MPQALWCRHCCGLPHWEIAHTSNNAKVTGVQQCTRTFTNNSNISSQSRLITVAIVPAVIYTEKCILSDAIWNRMRPQALMQNRHTRELISAWKTLHKHKKDLSHLQCTPGGVYVFTRMPGESSCRWCGSLLLCLCVIFQVLINLVVCCILSDFSTVLPFLNLRARHDLPLCKPELAVVCAMVGCNNTSHYMIRTCPVLSTCNTWGCAEALHFDVV